MRVWVPDYVLTGSFVNYWQEPGLLALSGAAGLLLCAFVFMVESVYNVGTFIFGAEEFG